MNFRPRLGKIKNLQKFQEIYLEARKNLAKKFIFKSIFSYQFFICKISITLIKILEFCADLVRIIDIFIGQMGLDG